MDKIKTPEQMWLEGQLRALLQEYAASNFPSKWQLLHQILRMTLTLNLSRIGK